MLATAGNGRDATSVRRIILWTNLGYVSILYISSMIGDHSVPGLIVTLESVLMLATAGDRDAMSVRRAILWTNFD